MRRSHLSRGRLRPPAAPWRDRPARMALVAAVALIGLAAASGCIAPSQGGPQERPISASQDPTTEPAGVAPSWAATPELGSLALFGSGAAGLAGYAMLRMRAARSRRSSSEEAENESTPNSW